MANKRRPWRSHAGKRVAAVKKFLKEAGKPSSNADRKAQHWKGLFRVPLTGAGQNFFRAPRSLFGGPQGGEPEHAASEDALRLAYAMY